MEGAGEGLYEAGVPGRDVVRHHVDQGSGGVEEVAGHGALGHLGGTGQSVMKSALTDLVKPVHVVRDTHLVVPRLAVPQQTRYSLVIIGE